MNNAYDDKESRYNFPTIGLRDVDQSVFDYFNKRLSLTVEVADGQSKKVPVMLATGERWNLIRSQKGIRDENKTLILPLITIQRLDVDRVLGFSGLGTETDSVTVSKRIHPETNIKQNLYQQRNKLWPTARKDKVIWEINTVPFPDFCNVFYQILIWSSYQSQMNEILEKIFYSYDAADSFVMPISLNKNDPSLLGNKGFFVGFRETTSLASQNNFEEFTDDERIIRYQYNIKVPAYFVLDPKDKPLSYGKERGGSKNDSGQHVVFKQQTADELIIESRNEKTLSNEEVAKLFDILI